MVIRTLTAVVALALVADCGPSSLPGSPGPTPKKVAVQASDLPKGMVKCDLSGDINSFINKEQAPDPNTAKSTKTDWDEAQKNGATAAYAGFYSDGADHCAAIKSGGTDIGAATYKLVVNFVIEFKDEKSAAAGYTSDKKIFGFSAAELRSGGAPVVEGTKTGLSQNSIVLSQSISNQSFYVAVWQNQAFMVILAVLNIDPTASKKVAIAVNNRIK